METDDSSLPFLNAMVQKNPKSFLGLAVYRKLMHTHLYLHASSHHNPLRKHAIQAKTTYNLESLDEEILNLKKAFRQNG
jgi:hypothetical protein